MEFKTKTELVWFTAETVISKEFSDNKTFPLDWGYSLTEEQIKFIPQKHLKDEILKDIDSFNELVITAIGLRLNWLLAEGFTVIDGDNYKFLSDQEMQQELDNILNS